jgi:hypothetical protein
VFLMSEVPLQVQRLPGRRRLVRETFIICVGVCRETVVSYRGTSPIRKRPPPEDPSRGYLAHKKMTSPRTLP